MKKIIKFFNIFELFFRYFILTYLFFKKIKLAIASHPVTGFTLGK